MTITPSDWFVPAEATGDSGSHELMLFAHAAAMHLHDGRAASDSTLTFMSQNSQASDHRGSAGWGRQSDQVVLNGSFVKIEELSLSTQAEFLLELQALGMERIIIQAVLEKGLYDASSERCQSAAYDWHPGLPERLQSFLDQAHTLGIRVYIGLVMSSHDICPSSYFQGSSAARTQYETGKAVAVLTELFQHHPALAGWYIPDEPWLCTTNGSQVLLDYYSGLMREIRTHSDKPVLVSPYLAGCELINLTSWADRVARFQQQTGIDRLLFQDSVGAAGFDLHASGDGNNVRAALAAVAAVLEPEQFGVVNELFNCCTTSTPAMGGGGYRPSTIARLQSQLFQTQASDWHIAWLVQHHMSAVAANHHPEAARLAAEYETWLASDVQILIPDTYSLLVPVAPAIPIQLEQLFDFKTANPCRVKDPAWLEFVPAGEPVRLSITFTQPVMLRWVSMHLMQDEFLEVRYPERVRLYCRSAGAGDELRFSWERPGWVDGDAGEYVLANPQPMDITCREYVLEIDHSHPFYISELLLIGREIIPVALFEHLFMSEQLDLEQISALRVSGSR